MADTNPAPTISSQPLVRLDLIYLTEGDSELCAAIHCEGRLHRRLYVAGVSGWSATAAAAAAAATTQPVRMNHCRAGGIVPLVNLYAPGSCKSSLATPFVYASCFPPNKLLDFP